jgi:ABC-type polysaccharide/polyol phosphate export permease
MERGLGWLVRLNPIVPFLDLIRVPMLEGKVADPLTWGLALGISGLFSLTAGLALRAREDKVILHL